jgi:uncharacterized membrane protein YraQ (UPF0718 family)
VDALAAIWQALVSHRTLGRLLGDVSPRSLSLATLFGIASSSCSYAAVALARSLFRKGASFTAAIVFQLASTNLVIELGIILIVLLGWPFAAVLVVRFLRTGGLAMLRMMNVPEEQMAMEHATGGDNGASGQHTHVPE